MVSCIGAAPRRAASFEEGARDPGTGVAREAYMAFGTLCGVLEAVMRVLAARDAVVSAYCGRGRLGGAVPARGGSLSGRRSPPGRRLGRAAAPADADGQRCVGRRALPADAGRGRAGVACARRRSLAR